MRVSESKGESRPELNDSLTIIMESVLKAEIQDLADAEERKLSVMARILLREAVNARKSKAASAVA